MNASVDSAVEITKKYNHKASGYVNAVLRKFADAPKEKRDLEQFKPGIRVALKPEIYGIFKKDFGKQEALEIGKALLEPAHITVRFDAHKVDQKTLIADTLISTDSMRTAFIFAVLRILQILLLRLTVTIMMS